MRSALTRLVLWDYSRESWQYGVLVALILVFILLTPREWFRDQARVSSVVMLDIQHGSSVFWIEPELLAGISESERDLRASTLLKDPTGHRHTLLRLEPIFDAEKEIKGFMAHARP